MAGQGKAAFPSRSAACPACIGRGILASTPSAWLHPWPARYYLRNAWARVVAKHRLDRHTPDPRLAEVAAAIDRDALRWRLALGGTLALLEAVRAMLPATTDDP